MEDVAPTAGNLSAFVHTECRSVFARLDASFAAQHNLFSKGGAKGSKGSAKGGKEGGKKGGKGGKKGGKKGKGDWSRDGKGASQSWWGSSGWGGSWNAWQQ